MVPFLSRSVLSKKAKQDSNRAWLYSAKYGGGVSPNSLLLQGPDLTNQIVRVLTRSREDQVALVGDIERIFCQVCVPKHQWDMCPEGDLSAKLREYQICVHLFGWTHLPSTCNYALSKTAKDDTEQFGQEAASTLINNVYVDDILKSAPDVSSAVHLFKRVKQMCSTGGFPLSKFVSSSREVFQTIPPGDRSKEVKNIEFDNQTLRKCSWCQLAYRKRFLELCWRMAHLFLLYILVLCGLRLLWILVILILIMGAPQIPVNPDFRVSDNNPKRRGTCFKSRYNLTTVFCPWKIVRNLCNILF